jgi:hypothetical protein
MTDQDPETIDDDLADEAGELILEAEQQYQQNQAEQAEFMKSVAEESGEETLETKCEIGGHTVPVSATFNGELMDQMGALEDRVNRIEAGDAGVQDISDTADKLSQLLADIINDDEATKRGFYKTYQEHGIGPLSEMLETVFGSLKQERERRRGTADGFRSKSDGA